MSAQCEQIANLIESKLKTNLISLTKQWQNHQPINYFILDDVLPEELALSIYQAFPPNGAQMFLKNSLKERKFVSAQMNHYPQILEDVIFAFQAEPVVEIITKICNIPNLEPDSQLYAGGISLMSTGHFLNPHLDNSHDKQRQRYRVLNLLYYIAPQWQLSNGGNLELWPQGIKQAPLTVESKFNRLVLMITNTHSWHSVSKVTTESYRCCISNYYFARKSVEDKDYFHVTAFRGRPEQKLRDIYLRFDLWLRMRIRKLFPLGVDKDKHYYKP